MANEDIKSTEKNQHFSQTYTIPVIRNDVEYNPEFQSIDPIVIKSVQDETNQTGGHASVVKHPTSYSETLIHLLKGNIGTGLFAMGDAFKNSGIVVGPILVPFLGLICVHSQHLLLNASKHVQHRLNLPKNPNYAKTVELSFATGPERFQKLAPIMTNVVNLFLCITQLGFCCIYFVFISSNVKQIMDYYGIVYSVHVHMSVVLVPVWLSCLVRNLKLLVPLSTIANGLMLSGIVITLYYVCQPPYATTVAFVANIDQFPLFFGTAIFAFEGIGLVLPLQNEMKTQKHFDKTFGVLNIGMTVVNCLYLLLGVMAYLKYGDEIHGSVTLDIPQDEILALCAKVMISLGVLFTFALQFYIPIDIMFPVVREYFGSLTRPLLVELIFRTLFVLITFALAQIIPYLDLFVTLVGAFSSTTVALIFPPILQFVTAKLTPWIVVKNSFILAVGLLGCVTGSYESIRLIVKAFRQEAT